MQSAKFLAELRRSLPPSLSAIIVNSLREDLLVWNSLQDPAFLRLVLNRVGESESDWGPANLCCLAMGLEASPADLASELVPALEPECQKQALAALEDALRTGRAPRNLAEAGWLALGLRERRRRVGSWKGLLNEISPKAGMTAGQSLETWRTALACLFDLVPDAGDILKALLPKAGVQPALGWITHTLLANPMPASQRLPQFVELAGKLSMPIQVEWLRYLQQLGQEETASTLAKTLLESSHPAPETWLNEVEKPSNWLSLAEFGSRAQQYAALCRFAGRDGAAGLLMAATEQCLRAGLASILLQQAEISDSGEASSYCRQALLVEPDSRDLEAGCAAVLDDKLAVELPFHTTTPAVRLVQAARMAEEGQEGEAQDIAHQAALDWIAELKNQPAGKTAIFQQIFNAARWVNQLRSLRLAAEAAQLGEAFRAQRSADINLLDSLVAAYQEAGETGKALDCAQEAMLRDAKNPQRYRTAADLWENLGDWEKSMAERQMVLNLSVEASECDILAYAWAAIQAGRSGEAEQVCQSLLDQQPDHSLALTYLGVARAANGDLDRAAEILQRAALACPDQPLAWTSLAGVYEQRGESQRALDTLRAGVLANPQSSAVYCALGDACLRSGLASEALPHMRQAARLSPESVDVVSKLSDTLRGLGHADEAQEVISRARQTWPRHPALAYQDAVLHIDAEKWEEALVALEIALRSERTLPAWVLLYADTCLRYYREGSNDVSLLVRSQQVLQPLVAAQPSLTEARVLMGETLLLKGLSELAFERFKNLLENLKPEDQSLQWRINVGMGQSASQLGQYDTALAAIQSAALARPDNADLQRLLAETFCDANLPEEGMEAAGRAMQLEPRDQENLTWYAQLMTRLHHPAEAEEALRRAIELDADRPDLMIALATIQIHSGSFEQGQETLKNLTQMANASSNQLRQAAYLYLDLKQDLMALRSLQKAAQASTEPVAELFYEKACLNHRLTKDSDALEEIQQAIALKPDYAYLHLAQADLLAGQNRLQSALNALEKALDLSNPTIISPSTETEVAWRFAPKSGEVSEADLHARFAALLKRMGSISQAFEHAGKALEQDPNNITLRLLAAGLAQSLLRTSEAERLANIPEIDPKDAEQTFTSLVETSVIEQLAALCALNIELALDTEQLEKAQGWAEKGQKYSADNLRLRAAQVRLYRREGDVQAASQLYSSLFEKLEPAPDSLLMPQGLSLEGLESDPYLGTWMAEAALAALRWNEGMEALQQAIELAPADPSAQRAWIRAAVQAAETQVLCGELKCSAHAPGAAALGEERGKEIETALQRASKLLPEAMTAHWRARANAVFNPSKENVETLRPLATGEDATAALLLAARRSGLPISGPAVRDHFPQTTAIWAQIALSGLGSAQIEEYSIAQQVVEREPRNPLWHSLYALAAEEAGEKNFALESVEIALEQWPDEIEWHAWAARLAREIGCNQEAVEHWEKAFQLSGKQAKVAFELGRAHLQAGNVQKSVELLQQVCQNEPQNLESWLAYAGSLLEAERLEEALEAVQKAGILSDSDPRPLVLAGKIYLALGNPEEALEMAHQALSRAEHDQGAVLLESRAHAQMQDVTQAIYLIEQELLNDPQAEELQVERAHLINQRDGAEKVAPLLEELVARFPQNAELAAMLALAKTESGDIAGAEKAAMKSLRLNAQQPDMHLLLGYLDRQAGQLDQAVHHYTYAVQMAPEQVEGYLELGKAYLLRREFEQAIQTFRQAMVVAPKDHRPYYQAALVLRDGKDYHGAEDLLRKAAKLAPNEVNIRRQLGAVVALNLVHHSQEENSCL